MRLEEDPEVAGKAKQEMHITFLRGNPLGKQSF
jgi:hypothetical protein